MVPTLRAAGHPFWVVLSAPDLIACLLLQVQDTALSQEVSFVFSFVSFSVQCGLEPPSPGTLGLAIVLA